MMDDLDITTPIDLSWNSSPLYRQLSMLDRDTVLQFQRHRDYTYSLNIGGLLTDVETTKVLNRLSEKINKAIKALKAKL